MAKTIQEGAQQFVEVADEVIKNVPDEAVDDIMGAIQKEVDDYKLTKEMRKKIIDETGADEATVNKWQTVADVIQHVDTVELAKKHPGATASAVKVAATVIGICIPPALPVTAVVAVLPQNVAAKIVQYAGMATPEHIVHTIAKRQAEKKRAKLLALPEGQKEEKKEKKSLKEFFRNIFPKKKDAPALPEPENIEGTKENE